jgi:hypothetical protein
MHHHHAELEDWEQQVFRRLRERSGRCGESPSCLGLNPPSMPDPPHAHLAQRPTILLPHSGHLPFSLPPSSLRLNFSSTQLLSKNCLEEDASNKRLTLGQVNEKLDELAREVPSDAQVERGKEWQNHERVHIQTNVLR